MREDIGFNAALLPDPGHRNPTWVALVITAAIVVAIIAVVKYVW